MNALKEFALKEFSGESKWVLESLCNIHSSDENYEESSVFQDFLYYLGHIVYKGILPASKGSTQCVRDIKLYYDCIYKFTNKKLVSLSQSQVIGVLFKNFFSSEKFQEMTKIDKTLMRSPDRYIKVGVSILHLFET